MSDVINVLDHGLVRLVDHMGYDLSIVRNARVSYNVEWCAGEDEGKDKKLINYLMKNRHTTPFECCNFTFEVKAPSCTTCSAFCACACMGTPNTRFASMPKRC